MYYIKKKYDMIKMSPLLTENSALPTLFSVTDSHFVFAQQSENKMITMHNDNMPKQHKLG